MDARGFAFAVLWSTGVGCTPVPGELDLDDTVEGRSEAAYRFTPDAKTKSAPPPAAEPEPEPEPERRTKGPPRMTLSVEPSESGFGCWSVGATGFPAVSEADNLAVIPVSRTYQMSYTPGELELGWFNLQTGEQIRTDVIVTEDDSQDERAACRKAARRIRARIKTVNAELKAHRFEQMRALPVDFQHPDVGGAMYREDVPVTERAVMVGRQHGQIIARVVGVKVLERHEADGMTYVHSVYGHRAAGVAFVVTYDCVGEDCTCDPKFEAQLLHFDDATFATIERRPCVAEDEYECAPFDMLPGPMDPWEVG